MLVLVHNETEGACEGCLHCRNVYFSIALARVPVANLEQSSRGMYGNKEGRSGHEFLIVHVAGVHPGRAAVQTPSGRRSDAHTAEEGLQRYPDPRPKLPNHSLAVEGNDLEAAIRKVVRKKAAARPKAVA